MGVKVIDGARRVAQRPAEDGGGNRGPGTAAAAAIDVEKTSLLCSLNGLVMLEHRQLATGGRRWDPAAVARDARGCAPLCYVSYSFYGTSVLISVLT